MKLNQNENNQNNEDIDIQKNEEVYNEKNYKCEICGKEYKTLSGLRLHVINTHNMDYKEYKKQYVKKEKPENELIEQEQQQEQKTEEGVKENEIPISQIEDEKEKFLEQLQNEQKEEGGYEEIGTEIPEVERILTEDDYADIYVAVFSMIGNFLYKIDIYKYPEFINRLKRRGKLIEKIASKYIENEETMIMVVLAVDGIDDFMYLMSLKNLEKLKEKEKESGKNE